MGEILKFPDIWREWDDPCDNYPHWVDEAGHLQEAARPAIGNAAELVLLSKPAQPTHQIRKGEWTMEMSKEEMLKMTAENEQRRNELVSAATPLLDFLNKYYDPHAYAIVTEGRVEVVRGEISALLPMRD